MLSSNTGCAPGGSGICWPVRLRGWLENPGELVAAYVREGMTVLEPGCGMGLFTVPLARLVKDSGRLIFSKFSRGCPPGSINKRLAKAGLLARGDARLVPPESMQLSDLAFAVDSVIAVAAVHAKLFEEELKLRGELASR